MAERESECLTFGSYLRATIAAIASAAFVFAGIVVFVKYSPVLLGDWSRNASPALVSTIPYLAILLGIVSGWQSFQLSIQRTIENERKRKEKARKKKRKRSAC